LVGKYTLFDLQLRVLLIIIFLVHLVKPIFVVKESIIHPFGEIFFEAEKLGHQVTAVDNLFSSPASPPISACLFVNLAASSTEKTMIIWE
jgi:hypothetical protein